MRLRLHIDSLREELLSHLHGKRLWTDATSDLVAATESRIQPEGLRDTEPVDDCTNLGVLELARKSISALLESHAPLAGAVFAM